MIANIFEGNLIGFPALFFAFRVLRAVSSSAALRRVSYMCCLDLGCIHTWFGRSDRRLWSETCLLVFGGRLAKYFREEEGRPLIMDFESRDGLVRLRSSTLSPSYRRKVHSNTIYLDIYNDSISILEVLIERSENDSNGRKQIPIGSLHH